MNPNAALPLAIVVLIVGIWLFNCLNIMREYERAVVFRLGRVLKSEKGPGLVLDPRLKPRATFWATLDTSTRKRGLRRLMTISARIRPASVSSPKTAHTANIAVNTAKRQRTEPSCAAIAGIRPAGKRQRIASHAVVNQGLFFLNRSPSARSGAP